LIQDLQLINVDFKVDSKRAVDYFKQTSGDITEFGVIMDNNKHFCNDLHLTNSLVEFKHNVSTRINDLIANEMLYA
jgi:hypothetical protein